MRTSRISQETSKLFSNTTPLTTPRRSTRSSLARFAYDADSPSSRAPSTDIEDAIPDQPSLARKRKRTTTTIPPNRAPSKVKTEQELTLSTKPRPRKARTPARPIKDPATGLTTTAPPSDWAQTYSSVLTMRQPGGRASNAAVDTMGCERLAFSGASARDRRFHTLVALMLSSQTKDTVNAAAMLKLQEGLAPYKDGAAAGLNLENILAVEAERLNELIWQVGFHNNKTKYIKQAAVMLRDQWGGDIPPTVEGLMGLPGVGPKMAYLCMSAENGWNKVEGIGVDVHVHRITNLWGWNKTNTPEETRLALQAWLPREKWKEINWLLVGLGQTVCLPVGRKCGECELGLNGLCKAAERKKVIEGRRIRDERMKVEGDGTVVKTEETVEEEVVKEEAVNEDVVIKDESPESKLSRPRKRPAR